VHHDHGDDSAPRLLNWIEDRIHEVSGFCDLGRWCQSLPRLLC
jgi:hypothetical protein